MCTSSSECSGSYVCTSCGCQPCGALAEGCSAKDLCSSEFASRCDSVDVSSCSAAPTQAPTQGPTSAPTPAPTPASAAFTASKSSADLSIGACTIFCWPFLLFVLLLFTCLVLYVIVRRKRKKKENKVQPVFVRPKTQKKKKQVQPAPPAYMPTAAVVITVEQAPVKIVTPPKVPEVDYVMQKEAVEAAEAVKKFKPRLGITFETSVGQNGTEKVEKAVIAVHVHEGQQADRYGMCINDYITHIDGAPTPTKEAFAQRVRLYLPTQELTLTMLRGGKDGNKFELRTKMGAKNMTEEELYQLIEKARVNAPNYDSLSVAKLYPREGPAIWPRPAGAFGPDTPQNLPPK